MKGIGLHCWNYNWNIPKVWSAKADGEVGGGGGFRIDGEKAIGLKSWDKDCHTNSENSCSEEGTSVDEKCSEVDGVDGGGW